MTPLVSVCVPTRDRAGLLREALASALAQEGPELEVVVCDDASRDDTRGVVAGFGDRRVRYVRSSSPAGVARARARCVAEARGRYVAWLDSDDALLPGALARQVGVLESEPAVSLVHGGFEAVDAHGAPLPGWAGPFAHDTREHGPRAFAHLIAANEITTSTVVVRRAALEAAGPGALPALPSSSDWAMWLRLALEGDVAYTAAPAARYRQHRQTISHLAVAGGRRLRCDASVVRSLLRDEHDRLPDPRGTRRVARSALAAKALLHAGDLFTRGERERALRASALAVRFAPGLLGGPAPGLAAGALRGDATRFHRACATMLDRLSQSLAGTRFGARLAAAAAPDSAWDAALARAAQAVRRAVPADAHVGAVTKWDPALLALCGRGGRNFPDRRTLPDGYPADSEAAVAHLEQQRRDGVSHLVVPSPSFWWLEHYRGLAAHLEARHRLVWRDADCVIFDLRGAPAA